MALSQNSLPSSSTKGPGTLSSKVTAILSSSYADSDFRQALSALDAKGVGNNAQTRRQLRLALHKEALECNGGVIDDFGKIADQLRRIGMTLERFGKGFQEAKLRVSSAQQHTSDSLLEAGTLIEQTADVQFKQRVLSALVHRLVLSEDEVASLTHATQPMDDAFFDALSKAKYITKTCEILLGFENQALGLELMEETSRHLSSAYQKLYKWTQREFKTLNLESPQMNSSLRRALRLLSERPSLFQNCLLSFADARDRMLADAFIIALAGTSSSSGSQVHGVKPIDMAAHDPLRYVGDMLAWIHSAAVGEREALEVLFVSEGDEIAKGLQSGKESDLWHLASGSEEDALEFNSSAVLEELVGYGMSDVARILRQRVEQVIQSNEDILAAYKLANLLAFYSAIFSKLLGQDAALLDALQQLESAALRQFRSLIRDHIATLQSDFQQAPDDLCPPSFLHDALKQLESIMETYDSSFSSSSDRESDFQPILDETFDPFLSGCENMATTLENPASSLFLINCLNLAASTLTTHDFTRARTAKMAESIARERSKLESFQHSFLRRGSGLGRILQAVDEVADSEDPARALYEAEAFQADAIDQASRVLDKFLPSALMDAMENLGQLQDSGLARQITEDAARRFCDDFARLEEHICLVDGFSQRLSNYGDEVQNLKGLLHRTTGEVKVLLS